MKKCVCQGKQITLTDKEFLSSGGEGECFYHGGKIYKCYFKALAPSFVDKMKELMILDHPNIIRPLDILYSVTTNEPIGYIMDYADNTAGLPLLFTTSYITRNNISLHTTQQLIQQMMETTKFIHSKKCVGGDLNEFNILVDKTSYIKPAFIDVDSYATEHFPVTAIMPSIQDYTTKEFNELTDWYAMAINSFELYMGIHPYKGKHPVLKTIEDRCKAHVSVFNKDVGLPPSVRDFNSIPTNYLTWYKEVFEEGKRLPPPNMISAPQIRLKRKYVSASFNIEKIFTAEEPIKSVDWLYGNCTVMTENFIYINGKEFNRHHKYSVVIASTDGVLYEAYFTSDGLTLTDILRKQSFEDPTHMANKWMAIDGRLYALYESQLFEIEIRKMGDRVLALTCHTQSIAEQSSQTFSNVIYANIFGKAYFYIPGHKRVNIYQQPLLDGKKALDAMFSRDQLVVIAAESDGTIKRYVICTTPGALQIEITDIAMQEVNATVLSNNVCILYDSAEDQIDLDLVGQITHKIINDAGLPAGAILTSTGTTAHYFVEECLYKFSVK